MITEREKREVERTEKRDYSVHSVLGDEAATALLSVEQSSCNLLL